MADFERKSAIFLRLWHTSATVLRSAYWFQTMNKFTKGTRLTGNNLRVLGGFDYAFVEFNRLTPPCYSYYCASRHAQNWVLRF